MPVSMTGFARTEQHSEWGTLVCEIRSINHRYLELSLRLPEALRALETELRSKLKQRLGRGKVEVSFKLTLDEAKSRPLSINEALVDQLKTLSQSIASGLNHPAEISALDILAWPGVINKNEDSSDHIDADTLSVFDATLDDLVQHRQREGRELATFIEQRARDIEACVHAVRAAIPEVMARQEQKMREKIAALEVDIDEDRLAQELVYYAQRADLDEELDRLDAHLKEIYLALEKSTPVGRRLDFLMQELNREANTLSSKSLTADIRQHAVELKVLIEQMREQIQNLE